MTYIIHTLPKINARDVSRRKNKCPYGQRLNGHKKYPDDLIGHVRYLWSRGCKTSKIAAAFGIEPAYLSGILCYRFRSYIDAQRSIAYPDVEQINAAA